MKQRMITGHLTIFKLSIMTPSKPTHSSQITEVISLPFQTFLPDDPRLLAQVVTVCQVEQPGARGTGEPLRTCIDTDRPASGPIFHQINRKNLNKTDINQCKPRSSVGC